MSSTPADSGLCPDDMTIYPNVGTHDCHILHTEDGADRPAYCLGYPGRLSPPGGEQGGDPAILVLVESVGLGVGPHANPGTGRSGLRRDHFHDGIRYLPWNKDRMSATMGNADRRIEWVGDKLMVRYLKGKVGIFSGEGILHPHSPLIP